MKRVMSIIDVVGPNEDELKGKIKNTLIELLPDKETGRMKLAPSRSNAPCGRFGQKGHLVYFVCS